MEQELSTMVVATDLSRASEAAVRRAAWIAKARGVRLEIVHVVGQPALAEAWTWLREAAGMGAEDVKANAAQRLRLLASRLHLELGLTPDIHLAEGRPFEQISTRAHAVGAGLIVVGAHGENLLLDLFVGTTAQRVLRTAREPVLLVKQTPGVAYEHILLATDFSPVCRTAAAVARELFPTARFTLLHAYRNPFERELALANSADEIIERYRRQAEAHAREQLERFAAEAGFPGDVQRKLRYGYPPVRVNELARELDVDLIVVGAHGKSVLEATVLGSVSAHVIMESHCDVLLVKEGCQAAGLFGGAPALLRSSR
jgi:nucleotide-binding universal stress UspA family protein